MRSTISSALRARVLI